MASTEKRTRGGKVTWSARWRDPAGKQRRQSNFPRKMDAQAFLDKIETDKSRGTYVDPSAGKASVGEYSKTWLAGQVQLKPSTRARYEGLLREHVLQKWKEHPLSAVTHDDVSSWVQQMSASGAAPSTVRQAHRVLSLVLDRAVRQGRLTQNPALKVPLPSARRAEPRFLTMAESSRSPGRAASRTTSWCVSWRSPGFVSVRSRRSGSTAWTCTAGGPGLWSR